MYVEVYCLILEVLYFWIILSEMGLIMCDVMCMIVYFE